MRTGESLILARQYPEDRQKCLSFTFMRKTLIALSLVLVGACASGGGTNATSNNKTAANATSPAPEVQIMQVGGVPPAARHVRGGVSVQYAVEVSNPSSEAITLKRINVQSVSEGAYNVRHSQPFDKLIPASERHVVEFFAPAYASGNSVVGANGPVTLRVIAEFDGPRGGFQEVVTQVVNTGTGVSGQ